MILYDRQVQEEEIRAEEIERIYFYLNDKSPVQQSWGARYVRWACNSGWSEGRELFHEQMTAQIRARDRVLLRCPDQTGKVVLPRC